MHLVCLNEDEPNGYVAKIYNSYIKGFMIKQNKWPKIIMGACKHPSNMLPYIKDFF